MNPRERDLLRAVARFLRDYCGDDALHRWQEKLSDREREWLAPASGPVKEACRRFVEALRVMFRALTETMASARRAVSEVVATVWAMVSSFKTELFGHGAL